MNCNFEQLPEHIRGTMYRYVIHGCHPGHFLGAVMENKLLQSYQYADDININHMFDIVKWVYNYAPCDSHGSVEKVRAWIDSGGFQGIYGRYHSVEEEEVK